MAEAALPRPAAILFDWDNTLVDTWPCIGKAINTTLTHMGHTEWTDAEVRQRVAGSLRDTFPGLFGERWPEARDIFYKTFGEVHLDMLAVTSGSHNLLATLKEAAVYRGVVSNKTGTYLRTEAAHLGWSPYFGKLVGAQDAPRDKPAPDPIYMALDGSGIAPGPHVWFVGDASIDMRCGKAANCTTVLVRTEPPDLPDFTDAWPDRHVADCANLIGIIRASL